MEKPVKRSHVLLLILGIVFIIWAWPIMEYYGPTQIGEHLWGYVLPSIWQYSYGVPFIEGFKIGKKAIIAQINTLEVRPKPNQMINKGAIAIFGSVCRATRYG